MTTFVTVEAKATSGELGISAVVRSARADRAVLERTRALYLSEDDAVWEGCRLARLRGWTVVVELGAE